MKYIVFIIVIFSSSTQSFAQSSFEKQTHAYFDIPINITYSLNPIPVKGSDGKWHLSYTLFITNYAFSNLKLLSVDVTDKRNSVLAHYGNKELQEYYRYRSLMPTPPRATMPNNMFPDSLLSGRTAVLLFWIDLNNPKSIPLSLAHKLIFKNNPLIKILKDSIYDSDSNIVFKNFTLPVSKEKPIAISSPLKGKNWICANGPAYNTDHQYLTIRDGKFRIAQRFAFDFKKVDNGKNILPSPFPDTITNKMFYGYGQNVYAVADGSVVYVKDGIPENVPQANGDFIPAVPIRNETVSGNQITLKIDKGHYVFYAHLQPGSIKVKEGDKIVKGQVIGLLGNSGNAINPHLHFHIGNTNSLNGTEGLPFVFDSVQINGKRYKNVIPMNDNIVDF